MRHIWICLIDGVIVRSGPVQPTDTMPVLLERLMRVYPHMQSDSLKVIREDGLIFDSELSFSNPAHNDPNRPDVDDLLAAVGVVEGHLGVQIYHGKTPEEILIGESKTFPEIITEQMDFGIFNFAGDQLISIEDMITYLGPQCVPDFQPREGQRNSGGVGGNGGGGGRNSNRNRNRRGMRRRGRDRDRRGNQNKQGGNNGPEQGGQNPENQSPETESSQDVNQGGDVTSENEPFQEHDDVQDDQSQDNHDDHEHDESCEHQGHRDSFEEDSSQSRRDDRQESSESSHSDSSSPSEKQ